MHEGRFNRRALLGKAARLAGSLPIISSVITACIGDDDEPTPTASPAPETATPAPTATPEPSPTATATLTAALTATPTAAATATATEPSSPTSTPTLVPADPELLAELRELAIPFDTAEPESGFSDLNPFREIVGDARIVALGEMTHGTSEFFKMKHRLTEYLVTEMGFTTFAIEAPWPATKVINRYVHGDDATQEAILRGLTFNVWRTQEVLDLVEWMRRYNTQPGIIPVSFKAFDMQINRRLAEDQLLAFVEDAEPAGVDRFRAYFRAARTGGAQDALDDLLAHRDQYTNVASTEPYEDIVQTARMIVQAQAFEEIRRSTDPEGLAHQFELRDRYMAENASWLLEQAGEDAKIILWAHNGHIGTSIQFTDDGLPLRPMGVNLREQYGDELIAVGFDTTAGTFTAAGVGQSAGQLEHEIPPPSPGSFESTFAQLGLPRFMLHLRAVEPGSLAGDWLHAEHLMWGIGAVFDASTPDNYRGAISLPPAADVLIYFHETHASQRLF